MDKSKIAKKYKDGNILILGLGREGRDSYAFFRRLFPKKTIGLADKSVCESLEPVFLKRASKDKFAKLHLGADYLKHLKDYDVIVKSPGIPIHLPEIEAARKSQKITTQTKIFFDFFPGTIIGVTGTKGKSTTSALIFGVLKKAGKRVKLLGNIGKPILSELLEAKTGDYLVCELSSHQLYDLKKSPHVAVLLNLYPEHLDYYRDFGEYAAAKANIAIHQNKNDFLIYDSANPFVARIAKKSKAKKIDIGGYRWDFPKDKIPLIGEYNAQNAKAAAIAGKILGVNQKTVDKAIAGFKPLKHRLEFAGRYGGIDFYNDSLSTIQESAAAAIDGLGERVETLIAGGFDRRQPFDLLAEKILASGIKTLILFPTTGERIWKEIEKRNLRGTGRKKIACFFAASMDEAVKTALAETAPGKICLMSCASSSFSLFKDYEEKGRLFTACLEKYAAPAQQSRKK